MSEKGSLVTVRASAALEASGAFDPTPLALPLDPITETLTLYVTFARGSSSSSAKLRVLESPDGVTYYYQCVGDAAALTTSAPYKRVPASIVEYLLPVPASGSEVRFAIPLNVHGAKAIKIEFAEYGDTANPGTLAASLQVGAS